jgi:ABC-type multidrug transport system ATPase subunit
MHVRDISPGKTTLMDILFGRAKEGTVSGEILVNGQRLQEVPFTAICGYTLVR